MSAPSASRLDEALAKLDLAPLTVGCVKLADLLGIDHGVAVRWAPTLVHLTPHGGVLITRRLLEALERRGVQVRPADLDPIASFPETTELVEACALDALAHAASPRAIDVILRQRDLWRSAGSGGAVRHADRATQTNLDRLLRPPTIVMLGAPNIGKSTLTNALAGRLVSIVADEPGVTRDHVGVTLDMDGLAVRLVDAPGIATARAAAPGDAGARELAMLAARQADLLMLCADHAAPFPDLVALGFPKQTPSVRVGLRRDLGPVAEAEIEVSVHAARGLEEAALAIRRRLLPDAVLATTDLWRFHPSLPPGSFRS